MTCLLKWKLKFDEKINYWILNCKNVNESFKMIGRVNCIQKKRHDINSKEN